MSPRNFREVLARMGPLIPVGREEAFAASWVRVHGRPMSEVERDWVHNWLSEFEITYGCVRAVEEGLLEISGIDDAGEPLWRLTSGGRTHAQELLGEKPSPPA